MRIENPSLKTDKKFAFNMDLLSHDVLNSNQAVLGYLELMLASPRMEGDVREFGEKAVAQVHASNLLFEDMKKLFVSQATDIRSLKPLDLKESIGSAREKLRKLYPHRNVRVNVSAKPRTVRVLGSILVADLVLNLLFSMLRFDTGDEVAISVTFSRRESKGMRLVETRIEDMEAKSPQKLKEDLGSMHLGDVSRAVRLSALLFSKMVAENLGGDLRAEDLSRDGTGRGMAFVLTLREAGET